MKRQGHGPLGVGCVETLQCSFHRVLDLGSADRFGLLELWRHDLQIAQRQQVRMRQIDGIAAHLHGVLGGADHCGANPHLRRAQRNVAAAKLIRARPHAPS